MLIVDPGLHVKADFTFHMAKLSTSCGFTKGVSVDVSCL